MNISLLLHTPLFAVTIFFFIGFVCLSILMLKNPARVLSENNPADAIRSISVCLLLGFCVLCFSRGESILWSLQNPENLLTTEGRILYSTTEVDGDTLHYRIGYEYAVKEESYWSDRVSYGFTGSDDDSFATNYVLKYPVGKPVVVYYDPIDPEKSVLEPEAKEYDSFLVGIMLIIFEAFIITIGFAHKLRPTMRAADGGWAARF